MVYANFSPFFRAKNHLKLVITRRSSRTPALPCDRFIILVIIFSPETAEIPIYGQLLPCSSPFLFDESICKCFIISTQILLRTSKLKVQIDRRQLAGSGAGQTVENLAKSEQDDPRRGNS